MQKKRIISIDISEISYADSLNRIVDLATKGQSSYICVANVHMLVEAQKDSNFAEIINAADLAVADGMPLIRSMKSFYDIKQERIAGMDLFNDVASAAEKSGLLIFFYGSTDEVLSIIADKISVDFPQLNIAGLYSPPFRDLTEKEEDDVINLIADSKAKIVFVGLGCPKQEKWMAKMKDKINAVMIGLGGALPVYAGLQKRAPEWMQKNGLEWLFRFIQEPRRLWKRYLITNSYFIWLYFKHTINKASKN